MARADGRLPAERLRDRQRVRREVQSARALGAGALLRLPGPVARLHPGSVRSTAYSFLFYYDSVNTYQLYARIFLKIPQNSPTQSVITEKQMAIFIVGFFILITCRYSGKPLIYNFYFNDQIPPQHRDY